MNSGVGEKVTSLILTVLPDKTVVHSIYSVAMFAGAVFLHVMHFAVVRLSAICANVSVCVFAGFDGSHFATPFHTAFESFRHR